MSASSHVEVFVADEQTGRVVDCPRWAALARSALASERVRGPAELSLLFVDEETIAALAQRFLGHGGPTDVLSFPIEDEPFPSGRNPDGGGSGPGCELPEPSMVPVLLGDVVICPDVAARNAPEHEGDRHSGSYEDEVALLVVHGILHLLGMDHEDPEEAEKMEAREQELLDEHHRPGSSSPDGAGPTADAPGEDLPGEEALGEDLPGEEALGEDLPGEDLPGEGAWPAR